MSASPCFQCFKAVFFLHFYPPHVSKVSRKERKCYFLSAICSVNSLFRSATTLPSALTEALRNKSYSCYCTFFSSHNAPCNSKTVFVRLCALLVCVSKDLVLQLLATRKYFLGTSYIIIIIMRIPIKTPRRSLW